MQQEHQRQRERRRVVSVLLWSVGWALLVAQTCPSIQYVYDPAGRLHAVVDPSSTDPAGGAAVYHYDPVGNITSIERYPANQLRVLAVTPLCVAGGDFIAVRGTGFSATAAENEVTFPNVAMPQVPLVAGTFQLTVPVPEGVGTGSITVKHLPTSAETTSLESLNESCGHPTQVTGVIPTQPITVPGDPLLIVGEGFDTVASGNTCSINGHLVTVVDAVETVLQVIISQVATTGHVAVTSLNGTATGDFIVFVVPEGRPAADVEFTGMVVPGDGSAPGEVTYALSAPDRLALVAFDALSGQRISIRQEGTNQPGTVLLQTNVLDPNGQVIGTNIDNAFMEPISLALAGTYLIRVESLPPGPWDDHLQVFDVPDDVLSAIGVATPIPLVIGTPGQAGTATFSGTAGDRISVDCTEDFPPLEGAIVSLLDPTGAPVGQSFTCDPNIGFNDLGGPYDLPTTGSYSIHASPQQGAVGTVTLTYWVLPPDPLGVAVIDGAPVSLTSTTPGQVIKFTFSGMATQRVSIVYSKTIPTVAPLDVYDPGGARIGGVNNAGLVPPFTLPTNGTYTIVVDPIGTGVGGATVQLFSVDDPSVTVLIDGDPETLTIDAPGEVARFFFSGSPGQAVSIDYSETINTVAQLRVYDPQGTLVDSTSSAGILPPIVLVAGQYKIEVDPTGTGVGDATISVFEVPAP